MPVRNKCYAKIRIVPLILRRILDGVRRSGRSDAAQPDCKYTKYMRQMSGIKRFLWLSAVLLTACQADDPADGLPRPAAEGVSFRMSCAGYEDGNVRSDLRQEAEYDRVEFCVVDGSGSAVGGVKCLYDPAASEVRIEGLREGDYRLLVLGVRGDAEADGVTIRTIRSEEDEWLSFPADLQRPLGAEYFHSRTPFSVVARKGPSGTELEAVVEEEVIQHRIIGRTDFSFAFNNPYVETALQTRRVTLLAPRFRTGLTGGGLFAGTATAPTSNWTWTRRQPGSFRRRPRMSRFTARLS